MNMKDVKAITIPEGTVKKIEDSNGNILWGSQDAFPYRRLEYIHFNGNDYINSGFTPWNNFGFYLDIQWDQRADDQYQYNGHGRVISNNRCFIGSETGGKASYGSGAASGNISSSNTFERHTYQVNTSSTSTGGKFYIDGVQVWSGNSSYKETNRGTIYVGAVYRNSSDYSYCKAKIYNVRFINSVSTSSIITWNWIPVQRKSDNAIGFLNLVSNGSKTFYTSVNGLLEAGPVIDEYWDLQA